MQPIILKQTTYFSFMLMFWTDNATLTAVAQKEIIQNMIVWVFECISFSAFSDMSHISSSDTLYLIFVKINYVYMDFLYLYTFFTYHY